MDADRPTRRPRQVLPDACSDLIWQAGRGAFVAGPDTGPTPVSPPGSVRSARFRPGAGLRRLGLPLSELRDYAWASTCCAPPGRAAAPRPRLREAARRIAEIALASAPADAAVTEAAAAGDPRTRVETLAGDHGLSERQLRGALREAGCDLSRRRSSACCASPASWRPRDGDLALAALDAGYADQSHLTRECTRLAARPLGEAVFAGGQGVTAPG